MSSKAAERLDQATHGQRLGAFSVAFNNLYVSGAKYSLSPPPDGAPAPLEQRGASRGLTPSLCNARHRPGGLESLGLYDHSPEPILFVAQTSQWDISTALAEGGQNSQHRSAHRSGTTVH